MQKSKALLMISVAMAACAAALPRGLMSVRAEVAGGEVKATVDALNQAFATFKAEHTKQLDDVKKGQADALQALKVDRINADIEKLQSAVDEANTKIAAGQMGGGATSGLKDKEYSAAFQSHFKRGDVQAALNKGVAGEGGYLAPVEWDRSITTKLIEVSPLRAICATQTISTNGFSKLFTIAGTASGWVGEAAARPVTANSTFGSLAYNTGEIYANPTATQQMLDDAEIDLEAWLASEVETEFAYQEGVAFLTGSGVSKPTGLLTYITGAANAAVHPYGAITAVNSGAAAALTADGLIDLTASLPTELTGNARLIANRSTITAARKLKDGQGNYLWQPSFVAGAPATINGYGVTEVAGMPDVAAGAKAMMFGDFKRGYLVIDRTGVRVLRDPFTNKPYVSFYTTKRVGGGLLDPSYLKALNISI
jgi:HK97 family phage major capsid protein